MARYLLDTNILLRTANKSSSQHSSAVAAMTTLIARGDDLVVTPQVLVEFWAVASRPLIANGFEWPTKDVREAIDLILGRLPLILETPNVFPSGFGFRPRIKLSGRKHTTRGLPRLHD